MDWHDIAFSVALICGNLSAYFAGRAAGYNKFVKMLRNQVASAQQAQSAFQSQQGGLYAAPRNQDDTQSRGTGSGSA